MSIVLVGSRNGVATINWPGVLAASGVVAAISVVGSLAFMLATGWFSLPALIMTVAFVVGTVVGMSVQRSMHLPIQQLTPLK